VSGTKTQNSVAGHGRRARIAKGGSPVHIRCACGWVSESFGERSEAEAAHAEHLKTLPDVPAETPNKAGGGRRRSPARTKRSEGDESPSRPVKKATAGARARTPAKSSSPVGSAAPPKPRVAPPRGPKSPPKGVVEPVEGHGPEPRENPSFLPWHIRCECGWNSPLLKTREEAEIEHSQHLVDVRD